MRLVIVSTQRPNVAPFDVLQHNALGSWLPIADEVVFCYPEGGESHYTGTHEKVRTAAVPGAKDLPSVRGMLDVAHDADADVILLANADIIMTTGMQRVAWFLRRAMKGKPFCASTRRFDINVSHKIEWERFRKPGYMQEMAEYLHRINASMHRPDGMDVFLFDKNWDWSQLSFDLVVGAPAWDNKTAALAIERGVFIDLTPVAWIVHQNHTRNYDTELTERNRKVGRVIRKQGRSLAACTHRVGERNGKLYVKAVPRPKTPKKKASK